MDVYIYNLSNKKMCVYNKKNMCIYMCVWGCLDKYISVATWPPQTKIPGFAPVYKQISNTLESSFTELTYY